MDKITPIEGDIKTKAIITKETVEKKERKRKSKAKGEVKTRKVRKNAPKDTSIQDTREGPPDIQTEFNEQGSAFEINQTGSMQILIEPKVDTIAALVKEPVSFSQTGTYFSIDPNCKDKTNVSVLPSLDAGFMKQLQDKLQKPIQPPARMGHIRVLEESTSFF